MSKMIMKKIIVFCLRKIKKYKKFHLIADKKIQNDDLSLALDFGRL